MKTICILTAGKGIRLNEYSSLVNKALLPINKKAAISHIIDNFPRDSKIVVAIGHLGDQVKTFLKFCYPKRNIKFVRIKNYSGKGFDQIKYCLDLLKNDKYSRRILMTTYSHRPEEVRGPFHDPRRGLVAKRIGP